jgi:hypothetical protein
MDDQLSNTAPPAARFEVAQSTSGRWYIYDREQGRPVIPHTGHAPAAFDSEWDARGYLRAMLGQVTPTVGRSGSHRGERSRWHLRNMPPAGGSPVFASRDEALAELGRFLEWRDVLYGVAP